MPAPDFLAEINPWREAIAGDLLAGGAPPSPRDLQQNVDRTLLRQVFRHIARTHGTGAPENPALSDDHAPHRRDFATLPPDILGRVYEHCLDHPIHLDSAGHPAIEKTSTARKSAGVFYTPTSVVDYIVGQTLGRQLGAPVSLTDTQAPKILDPACGSGSFLIAAYQHLLDRHLAQSQQEKRSDNLLEKEDGTQSLTPAERIRILLAHIHGVDIDPQAVELTKLSLTLLTLAPGTSGPLPDLDQNIRCADALTPADTFDWPAAFPKAFTRGGFDCIIGNPPYLFGEHLDPAETESLKQRFPAAADQADAYQFFLELTGRLANRSAATGMLVPDAVLARSGCKTIRGLLLRSGLERIYHCGPVFGAGVSTVVLIQSAGHAGPIACDDLQGNRIQTRHRCRRDRFTNDPEHRLLIHATDAEHELLEKIALASTPLGEFGTLSRGEELGRKHLAASGAIPILLGRDVSRYRIAPPTHFVDSLRKPAEIYQPGKILIVKTGSTPVAAIDTEGRATLQSLYNFHPHPDAPDPHYLLAIINSRLIAWWIHKTFTAYKKLFPQLNQETIGGLPIRLPGNSAGSLYQNMLNSADESLALIRQLTGEPSPPAVELLNRQVTATDRRIDQMVCELYGLTDEEIALVEFRTEGSGD